jgi:hypothetical protein
MANIFPRSSNFLPLKVIACGAVTVPLVIAAVWYYFTPKYTRVGYMPTQPVPFSHALHVGQLGMDCRYCHSFVEVGGPANIPTTQTCMNCHSQVKKDSSKLAAVRESWETGKPIPWVKIHQAPDYVYFNHSVHVNRGMEVVYHAEPHSMGWCLECHRNPEKHIRPVEHVFNLDWKPEMIGEKQETLGKRLAADWNIQPPQNCAACHR